MAAVPQISTLALCDLCGGRAGEGSFVNQEAKSDGIYLILAAFVGEPGHGDVGLGSARRFERYEGRMAHVCFSAWCSGRLVEAVYRGIFDATVSAEARSEALAGFVNYSWATFRMHAISQFAMMLVGLPEGHPLAGLARLDDETVARSVQRGLEPSSFESGT